MTRSFQRILLVLGVVAVLPAVAGDGVVQRRAVIVGISDYDGTANDLTYCDDDAIGVRDALVKDPRWGSAGITLLLNTQATKTNIVNAVTAMRAASDDDDLCLFYFSGHGGNVLDRSPYDETDGLDEFITSYYIQRDLILDDEMGTLFAGFTTPNLLIILDTCYSGGMAQRSVDGAAVKANGELAVKSITPHGKKPAKGDGFLDDVKKARKHKPKKAARATSPAVADDLTARDVTTRDGLVALSACDEGELSYESAAWGHGIFTYALLKAMATPAADSGANNELSAEESYAYLVPLVAAAVPQQHPQLYDGNGAPQLDYLRSNRTTALTAVRLAVAPPAPQAPGTPLTLTATPTGGVNVQYRFFAAVNGGAYTTVRPYQAAAQFGYTPAVAGQYLFLAWARETGSTRSWDAYTVVSYSVTAVAAPLTRVSLTASPAAAQAVNRAVTLTATPTGGSAVSYRFFVLRQGDGTWTQLRPYATAPTVTWTPTSTGQYTLLVWARDAASTKSWDAYTTISYTVTP